MNAEDPRPAPATLSDRVQSLRLPDRNGTGRGAKLPWVLCLLLLSSTVTFGYQSFRKAGPGSGGAPGKDGAPALDGKAADSADVVLQAKGYIIPAHQIQVSPQVGGKIESLYITEGMRVEKGQILAQIEVVDYETDYKRAERKYKAAVCKLESARSTYELASSGLPNEVEKSQQELEEARADRTEVYSRLDRAQRLPRNTQSDEDLVRLREQTRMAEARVRKKTEDLKLAKLGQLRVKAAKADMDAAESEVEATRADLEKAVWKLDNCTVLAPVSGTILTKKAEESNLVNPVAFNVSATLCDMADLSDLEVDLTIQERDIANVFVEQNCTIMPEAFQSDKKFLARHPKGYVGTVTRLMPIADRAKGAIPVRVGLKVPKDEEGVYLKPDMGVIVSFKKPGK